MTITTAGTTAMEAKAKERLYRLVEQIPEGDIRAAERYLEYLAERGDPFIRKLMNAPLDDEPVTEEEEAGVREAWEDYKAGRVHSLEEIKQELGL
jgi:hypothetical protein